MIIETRISVCRVIVGAHHRRFASRVAPFVNRLYVSRALIISVQQFLFFSELQLQKLQYVMEGYLMCSFLQFVTNANFLLLDVTMWALACHTHVFAIDLCSAKN